MIVISIQMQNLVQIKHDKHDINNRIIKEPKFLSRVDDKSLQLSDTVVLYNDNFTWKIVPLEIMLMYPVIHDQYENKIITIYVCPYTLFSCVYFDQFYLNNQVYNNNLTLINDNNTIIPIIGQIYTKDMNIMKSYIRKNEVKIMTLRNAISMFPDCQFIDTSDIKKIEPLVDKNYLKNKQIEFLSTDKYSDKYDPKQIIYVIEYYSKKQDDYKYSVIVPKENIFDISKNKFEIYFDKMIEKVRDKGGHIYTCLWFAWSATHNKFKIINI